MLWIYVLAKKTKTPWNTQKQQPTENQRIINIKMWAKEVPVFTFSFPGRAACRSAPRQLSHCHCGVQQKQTIFSSWNSCSDFFERAVLRLKLGQIDLSLKITRILLSWQTKYLQIKFTSRGKNWRMFFAFCFWFPYSQSTITNHLKLKEYVRTCTLYLPARLEVKTASEKRCWNSVQTTIKKCTTNG